MDLKRVEGDRTGQYVYIVGNAFVFHFNRVKNDIGVTYLKCRDCNARTNFRHNDPSKALGEPKHSHRPKGDDVRGLLFKEELRRRVRLNPNLSPRSIYDEVSADVR